MKSNLFRVALIGPESTGKTTLCKKLAEHFHTTWSPEFARDYIDKLNRPYTKEDILYCSEQQIEAQRKLESKANGFFFADTELIVCRVWLIDVFGECPEWIEKKLSKTSLIFIY